MRRKEADGFAQNQKLQKKVESLQRELDQKTAAQLGEGAEIDLYEALRENFEKDKIRRIKKGQPGAGIIHEVVHNGKICGTILYDSKNHNAWRNDFVSKLKADQLAADADHAILTSSVFPSGYQQLCVQEEVVIANPARVIELVSIIRSHLIQTHRQNLGTQEKLKKTEALYEFINSGHCRQLMDRYDSIAENLLELDTKEVESHSRNWEKRGKLIRDSQKIHRELREQIDRIVEGDPA